MMETLFSTYPKLRVIIPTRSNAKSFPEEIVYINLKSRNILENWIGRVIKLTHGTSVWHIENELILLLWFLYTWGCEAHIICVWHARILPGVASHTTAWVSYHSEEAFYAWPEYQSSPPKSHDQPSHPVQNPLDGNDSIKGWWTS